ncbi:aspartate/glutamate racemase family protein [Roseomonas xinghualingensis]|uniref:aspartate/glutamate racemase family protein n=1 Tax=Roseomonas xinghualingensis TaxID=2986475 RepID=UPI0021F1D69F|nr:aspartate/glutamate racemase family protein [Roseomonas sp. SXEYE001]
MPAPRLMLINAFSLAPGAYALRPHSGTREDLVMDYGNVAPALAGLEWDVHPGAPATHGQWPVETKEEFMMVGANRLPLVREACESGRFDAVVLLGGGDPGYLEAREIGRRYGIPVTSCAHAQMHIAVTQGYRFSIVDISETHNAQMAHLVVQYRFTEHCASIRNVNFPLPRPAHQGKQSIAQEKAQALSGQPSAMLEASIAAAEAAIEEDGAESIILGCSASYWMQPLLQQRLKEMGWNIPVLEGYRCAIELAKLFVSLGLDASGIAFPADQPRRWRARKPI